MRGKKSTLKRISRWLLWVLATLILLIALQVSVLAFPQIFLTEKVHVGNIVIYHDSESDHEIQQLASDVSRRIDGSGFGDSTQTYRIFYFSSANKYDWLTRLAMLTTHPQGFNLSILGNSYICRPRVLALAERTGGNPKYGIWEGNPAHTIAHEVAHQIIIDRFGRGVWKSLPHWKREGLPEYIANIEEIRNDSLATIPKHFEILNDDKIWGFERRWDRIHYEAGLLVEYLTDTRGYRMDDIIADSVTWDETIASLADWYQNSRDTASVEYDTP